MSLLQKALSLCCGFYIHNHNISSLKLSSATLYRTTTSYHTPQPPLKTTLIHIHMPNSPFHTTSGKQRRKLKPLSAAFPDLPPLDLTEDNVRQVLVDARGELGQIFDTDVGMTGTVDLAELDGPFVTIRLKGRFWHKRSTVLARVGNYLINRIPEILEVDIEDEKQLDDSPANF